MFHSGFNRIVKIFGILPFSILLFSLSTVLASNSAYSASHSAKGSSIDIISALTFIEKSCGNAEPCFWVTTENMSKPTKIFVSEKTIILDSEAFKVPVQNARFPAGKRIMFSAFSNETLDGIPEVWTAAFIWFGD